ncbi:transcriptional regulator NrdR, partial [Streptomyces sp. IF17]|nr:transcriptional regulator NrdR [Streptomyces alkaliphilus]
MATADRVPDNPGSPTGDDSEGPGRPPAPGAGRAPAGDAPPGGVRGAGLPAPR